MATPAIDSKSVRITLEPHATTAHVETMIGTGAIAIRDIPIMSLIELLSVAVKPLAGSGDTYFPAPNVPANWPLNLFPRVPYSMMESVNGYRLVVGGWPAPELKTIRYDTAADPLGQTFDVIVPPRLWVVRWGPNKIVNTAAIFTCEQMPRNVNDNDTVIYPWMMGNADHNGVMCWGNTKPAGYGADGVVEVDSTFFGTIFNHHIHRTTTNFLAWNKMEVDRLAADRRGGVAGVPTHPTVPHDYEHRTTLLRAIERTVTGTF